MTAAEPRPTDREEEQARKVARQWVRLDSPAGPMVMPADVWRRIVAAGQPRRFDLVRRLWATVGAVIRSLR